MKAKFILPLLLLAGLLPSSNLRAQIFESNIYGGSNTIGEYNLNGTPVGSGTLVSSGLDDPRSVAVSGSDIFVANEDNSTIGEYTTAGAPVGGGTLISSGLDNPLGIAVSGSLIFVANYSNNTIGEYTTSGSAVNTSVVYQFESPRIIQIFEPDSSLGICQITGCQTTQARNRTSTKKRSPLSGS